MEPVVQADYTVAREDTKSEKGLTPDNYRVTRELLEKKSKIQFNYIAFSAENG